MRSMVFVALSGALAVACDERPANAERAPVRTLAAAQTGLTDAQMVQACTAATALNAPDDVEVEASRRSGFESVHLVFAARADGTQWTVQCRLGDGALVWHVVDVEGGEDNQQLAEGAAAVMRYRLDGDSVQVMPAG